jgi:hypothetical protein
MYVFVHVYTNSLVVKHTAEPCYDIFHATPGILRQIRVTYVVSVNSGRSQATRGKAWVCCRSLAAITCSNPAGCTDVSRALSDRGLSVGLITRPEKSYRV